MFPPPIYLKGIQSFLGHIVFCGASLNISQKNFYPLCKLLETTVKFIFVEVCTKAFECMKAELVSTPVIINQDISESFKVMCKVSGTTLGVVIGQKRKKIFHPIYYASKALNRAQ